MVNWSLPEQDLPGNVSAGNPVNASWGNKVADSLNAAKDDISILADFQMGIEVEIPLTIDGELSFPNILENNTSYYRIGQLVVVGLALRLEPHSDYSGMIKFPSLPTPVESKLGELIPHGLHGAIIRARCDDMWPPGQAFLSRYIFDAPSGVFAEFSPCFYIRESIYVGEDSGTFSSWTSSWDGGDEPLDIFGTITYIAKEEEI